MLRIYLLLAITMAAICLPEQATAKAKKLHTVFDGVPVKYGEWTANLWIDTVIALDTIVGEPKITCVAKWKLNWVEGPGGVSKTVEDIPSEVLRDISLNDLDIYYSTGYDKRSTRHTGVVCDHGAITRHGSDEYSLSPPGSPNWNTYFLINAPVAFLEFEPQYLEAELAKKHAVHVRRKGIPQNTRGLSKQIVNADMNLRPIIDFLEKKEEEKELDDFEDMLEEIERPEQSDELASLDDELSEDTPQGEDNLDDFDKMLEGIEDEEAFQKLLKQRNQEIASLRKAHNTDLKTCNKQLQSLDEMCTFVRTLKLYSSKCDSDCRKRAEKRDAEKRARNRKACYERNRAKVEEHNRKIRESGTGKECKTKITAQFDTQINQVLARFYNEGKSQKLNSSMLKSLKTPPASKQQ